MLSAIGNVLPTTSIRHPKNQRARFHTSFLTVHQQNQIIDAKQEIFP